MTMQTRCSTHASKGGAMTPEFRDEIQGARSTPASAEFRDEILDAVSSVAAAPVSAGWLALGLLRLGAFGVFVAGLVAFLTQATAVLLFPWALDYDEGIIAHDSCLLAQGVQIYAPNTADHFVSAIYPPVYYDLCTLADQVTRLAHLGADIAAQRFAQVITQVPLDAPDAQQRWTPMALAALRRLLSHDLRWVYGPRTTAVGGHR